MSSSLLQSTLRALRGLWKGSLDDHRVLLLLRAALFVIVVTLIVLIAVDPVIRGFASVADAQNAVDPTLRERILTAWAKVALLDRARAYLRIDAIVFAPACLLFIVAFTLHFNIRLAEDGTPPVFLGWKISWRSLLAVPLLAFVAAILLDAASLYAACLTHSDGTHLGAWLHAAMRGLYWATLGLGGLAVVVAVWVFASWFFQSREDADGGSAQIRIAERQARLRAAIADMVLRSKYAVLVVVFFAALVLLMDQTRDALLRQISDAGTGDAGVFPTILGVAVTLAALVLLSRASWLWPRLILRLRSPEPGKWTSPASEAFAKWWCRILGVAPYFVVAVMIARTFHDVPWNDPATRWFVLTLALILAAAIVFFYRVSNRLPPGIDAPGYYDCADDAESARRDLDVIALIVVWGAPATFLLARFLGLMEWTPPLALAVITAGLATWAGLLGWVAYQSRRYAIPYLVLFVAIVGVLGLLDLTDAHRMRLWAANLGALDVSALRTLFGLAVVLFVIGLALAWFWSRRPVSGLARVVTGAIAMLAIAAVIKFHDIAPGPPADPSTRPDAQAALSDWIAQLPAEAFETADQARPDNRYPVFLVASEGGGIRSAYWTALVLWRMKYGIDDFDRRTFALSGTSGGALGLAVYRACSDDTDVTSESVKACIDRFGYSDMWTQLMGGMFFEDSVATVLPTRFCKQPGCGVLGRSWWFEGAIESAVPAMARRLGATTTTGRRLPYLFLNATRVETGERVIESDVQIDGLHFPDAVDLLALANADLPLSTAAHNSSRFPYTNPVGAVYGPTCPRDPRAAEPAPVKRKSGLCLRLQDGGYFDDSGALTTANLLRAITGCGNDPECAKPADRGMLWIKPVVIQIRNEDSFRIPPDRNWPSVCGTPEQWPYNPQRPDIRKPENIFPSVLAAPLTIFNTRTAHVRDFEGELEGDARAAWIGIGLIPAEAELRRDARAAWAKLGVEPPARDPATCGPLSEWIGTRPVHRFDLVDDGTLYPSGWMLSTRAMEGICTRAVVDTPYGPTLTEAKGYCAPKVAKNR